MHQYSLTRKLKGVTSQGKVMEQCRATLIASGKKGVSAVDNSQFQTPRKHQRHGVSSKMNMYSFRAFFRVKQLDDECEKIRNFIRPVIAYVNQEILPAIGMPPYHLYPQINASTFEPASLPGYINTYNHSSGACMEAYAERFELSQVISPFQRLIPHANRENEFKFQQEDVAKAISDARWQ